MDLRVLILTVPSLLILGLLVHHSLITMPRRRALAFWCAVTAYGVLRGVALRWVIDSGLAASFPYVIHDPLFPVLGVPLQEITGWAIVAYIGWWLGSRFSTKLFAQVAWACLFLGSISWTVEAAAVAAGWWHWTVPVSNSLFINVPFIGLIDWLFVGIDFLLPFAAITSPALAGRPARFVTLLGFPSHFTAHCFVERIGSALPIPVYHLSHWVLIGIVLWLAMRSQTSDAVFRKDTGPLDRLLPLAALGAILLDAAAVELLMARRPELLVSTLPSIAVALTSLSPLGPMVGASLGAAGLVAGIWLPPAMLAAVPAGLAGLLTWGRRHSRWVPAATLIAMALLAYQAHGAGARKHDELVKRLDAALAARDRGDLETAKMELETAAEEYPGSHVPLVLLGEIHYKTGQLGMARPLFARAVQVKQDYAQGYHYLAVIDLRLGRRESAATSAAEGLRISRGDLGLRYLRLRATDGDMRETLEAFDRLEPRRAHALASLAFEVGDITTTVKLLDRGLERWPQERGFHQSRVNAALASGDQQGARRAAAAWRAALPNDPEASEAARRLGIE